MSWTAKEIGAEMARIQELENKRLIQEAGAQAFLCALVDDVQGAHEWRRIGDSLAAQRPSKGATGIQEQP